jgi:hypothetical protein
MGVLISWAIPEASRPTDSSFWDWRSSSSMRLRSVMSRLTPTVLMTFPWWSKIGALTVWQRSTVPSCRVTARRSNKRGARARRRQSSGASGLVDGQAVVVERQAGCPRTGLRRSAAPPVVARRTIGTNPPLVVPLPLRSSVFLEQPALGGLLVVSSAEDSALPVWVYHRVECGELPCLRVGGLLRFEPEAVHSFARGQIAPASSQVSRPQLVPRKRTR